MSFGRGPPPDIRGMTSLKVDNLTYRTTPEDLRRVFSKYGSLICSIHIWSVPERLKFLNGCKFDHSYSNSPVGFKEYYNFKELSNHCAIAIEVERCGIWHQSAGELCNHCQKIQRCKIARLPGLSSWVLHYRIIIASWDHVCLLPIKTEVKRPGCK